MDSLGVNLAVTGFEAYQQQMNAAKSIGVDTGQALKLALNPVGMGDLTSNVDKAGAAFIASGKQAQQGLNWMRNASIATKKEILSLRTNIKDLERSALATSNQNTIFNKYSYDIKRLNTELVSAEKNLKYLNSINPNRQSPIGKQPSQLATGLAGFAPEALNKLGVPAEIASLAATPGATASITNGLTNLGSAVTGLGTAAAVSAGLITAAGVIFVKYSQNEYAEAERKLKQEEKLAIQYGKLNTPWQAAIEAQRKRLRQEFVDRSLESPIKIASEFMENASLKELMERKDFVGKMFRNNPIGEYAKFYADQESQISALIDRRRDPQNMADDMWKRADNAMRLRWEGEDGQKAFDIQQREERQRRFIEQQKKFNESAIDLRDSVFSMKSQDNPLLKTMLEIETASERARKQFGIFGDSVVNKIAEIDKANLNKVLGLQIAENRLTALGYDQKARQLGTMSERQFTPFQDRLSAVERAAQFTSNSMDLRRRYEEASFYAYGYNPNNPQSFEKQNPISDYQINIINQLKRLGIGETGVYGRGVIADEILKNIPSKDDLLKMLGSSDLGMRNDASRLLGYQAEALFEKQQTEMQKFKDSFDGMKANDLNRQFAQENLASIQNSFASGFIDEKALAQQRLNVFESLGNNLTPDMARGKMEAYIYAKNQTDQEESQSRKDISEIKGLLSTLIASATTNGLKLDPEMVNSLKQAASDVNITLTDKTGKVANSSVSKRPNVNLGNFSNGKTFSNDGNN